MNKIPETIEELKIAYRTKNLPAEEITRFFIGKDYKKPKAFGIYQDEVTGNFVVYKNKADGSRAIRYEGKDEAYAVKQLYTKLEEEIINQKSNQRNSSYRNRAPASKVASNMISGITVFMTICIIIMSLIFGMNSTRRGYYIYNNQCYYYQNGDWYDYDFGWNREYNVPKELKKNHNKYYRSTYYYSTYDASDFTYSGYYEEPSSSSSYSSDDYGSSWDSSDSWDSSSTDWDSDW